MSNLWLVTATRTITVAGSETTRQLPTFLVDGDIQGFHDEAGAEHIVREILPTAAADNATVTYDFGIVRAADNTVGNPPDPYAVSYRFTSVDEGLITARMTEVAEQWYPKDSGPFHAPAIGEALFQIGHNTLAMRADELTHDETAFIRKLARDLTGAIQEAREA